MSRIKFPFYGCVDVVTISCGTTHYLPNELYISRLFFALQLLAVLKIDKAASRDCTLGDIQQHEISEE